MPEPSIFRENAIKKYRQRQEQGVLLRIASPPAWVLLWATFLLLLGAGGLAWSIEVPISVQAQGVVLEQGATGQTSSEVIAVLFFLPNQLTNLHTGQSATVSIGSNSNVMNIVGSVGQVETTLVSPNELRSRYHLQGGLAQIIAGPSVPVTIVISSAASAQIYVGSLCHAQIQIGSQRVLSLLPDLKQMLGQ
ncbi:MAG: hypothetical protein ACRDHZ_18055 [Ktedonobacteraceae bacterium]